MIKYKSFSRDYTAMYPAGKKRKKKMGKFRENKE